MSCGVAEYLQGFFNVVIFRSIAYYLRFDVFENVGGHFTLPVKLLQVQVKKSCYSDRVAVHILPRTTV